MRGRQRARGSSSLHSPAGGELAAPGAPSDLAGRGSPRPGRAEGAGAARRAGRREAGGAGRGGARRGRGRRRGGGGGGGQGGGGEHGGCGERLKCLFFRPGERESDAIRRALPPDGWTAASNAWATLFPAAPSSGACAGSVLHPPAGVPLSRRRGPESRGGGGGLPARAAAEAAAAPPRSQASAAPVSAAQRRRRQVSGGRRAPSLPVGAAVTSRAAAEALGGGSSWRPSAPRSPFSPLRSPSHFPRVLPRPRAAGGGGGRSCHGHQLGAAPRRETAAAATSLPPFPVALVSAARASIRGGCARLAAAGRAWGAAPRVRRRSPPPPPPRGGAGSRRGRPSAPASAVTLASRVTSPSLACRDCEMGMTVASLSVSAAFDGASIYPGALAFSSS